MLFSLSKTQQAAVTKLEFFVVSDKTTVFADTTLKESRVICYASKSLTDTERRYCQTEKEALALVRSVERFHMYLYGRPLGLLTDCKALEYLFTPRSIPCAQIG